MKIYGINSGDGYELCHPKDENDFGSIATLINGRERRRTWSPIRMRIIKEDERGLCVSRTPRGSDHMHSSLGQEPLTLLDRCWRLAANYFRWHPPTRDCRYTTQQMSWML
jgi:hypothetical protein